jgi:excisionase family DNA binding protein
MQSESYARKKATRLKQAGLDNAIIGIVLGITASGVKRLLSPSTRKKAVFSSPAALLSTTQAARVLNVHENTIRRWSDCNKLRSYRIGSRRDRRFRLGDIRRLLETGVVDDTEGARRRLTELQKG